MSNGDDEKQVPFGNDRKKNKDNSNGKSNSLDAKFAKLAKFREVEQATTAVNAGR
ncbi:MAG: hypothetical protein ABI147_06920 [Acidobacteriaceae bacterium]